MNVPSVLIIYGGTSPERAVSLRSGSAVAKALADKRHKVSLVDLATTPQAAVIDQAKTHDIVFPLLHGAGGEDGSLQSLLERHSIPYVGANSQVSEICFDKPRYKHHVRQHSIDSPRGESVTKNTVWSSDFIHKPFVIKPHTGGSSIDTFIVRDPIDMDPAAITAALTRHSHMLLEELIDGQEITVAVVGDKVLPVIEIIPPGDAEFDYENKYNGKTAELCPPDNVSDEIQSQAEDLALRIHRHLGIHDLSRTDMIIRKGDQKLFVLETNTIPGMTEQSLVPKAAAAAGYTMPELCSRIVVSAYNRHTQYLSAA